MIVLTRCRPAPVDVVSVLTPNNFLLSESAITLERSYVGEKGLDVFCRECHDLQIFVDDIYRFGNIYKKQKFVTFDVG